MRVNQGGQQNLELGGVTLHPVYKIYSTEHNYIDVYSVCVFVYMDVYVYAL